MLFDWRSEQIGMSYLELRKIDKCRIIYIWNHCNHITSNNSIALLGRLILFLSRN